MMPADGYKFQDPVTYKIMRIKELLKNHVLSKTVMVPSEIFAFDRVIIPIYNEKMAAFRSIGSISFNDPSPSIVLHSIETIFNALYGLKVRDWCASHVQMKASALLHFDNPSEPLEYVPSKRHLDCMLPLTPRKGEEAIEELEVAYGLSERVTTSDLKAYRAELQCALETLSYLPAFEAIAMESVARGASS